MAVQRLSIEEVLTLLAETPIRLAGLTRGLTAAQLHTAPDADEWSANDVLAHLRACADVWGGAIATILAQDGPTLRSVNPRTWITQTDYLTGRFRPSLRAYTAQRTDLVAVLVGLSPRDWSRAATITGAGRPLVSTVSRYAQRLAVHERRHLEQVDQIARALRS